MNADVKYEFSFLKNFPISDKTKNALSPLCLRESTRNDETIRNPIV